MTVELNLPTTAIAEDLIKDDYLRESSTGPRRFVMPPPKLPFFMNPGNGQMDPELPFCPVCTIIPDEVETNNEVDEANESETDQENGTTLDPDVIILKTKFNLCETMTKSSLADDMQLILEKIPGVSLAVVNSTEQSFVIDHDPSVSTESVLNVLKSVGHSADVLDTGVSNTEPVMVSSQFAVEGICCASEVPPIRRIIKPLPGVSRIQVNILTKAVKVQHDCHLINAQVISQELSSNGFPSQITADGGALAKRKKTINQGHTVLGIHGRFLFSDIPRVQNVLKHLTGITRLAFIISDSVVQIDHDLYSVTSEQCKQALMSEFSCWILSSTEQAVGDAVTLAFEGIQRSRFVESTIQMEGLNSQLINKMKSVLSKEFKRTQIRAVHPNVAARTIKVEHDPQLATVVDISKIMNRHGLPKLLVVVDGADAGLYLPEGKKDAADGLLQEEEKSSLLKIHANVWISGFFWILSTFSYCQGCEWFEWFGIGSVLFGLPPIIAKAMRTLRRRDFDANCMMVTAALGSLVLGEFSEAASVSFLFSLSEFLEAKASMKARKALQAIVDLKPENANVIHPVSKDIIVVPADQVPPGSLISVKAGDKIAADGVVVEGSTAIDESSLTGEAKPAHKNVGDAVRGGTINIGTSPLVVRTTTSVEDSAVTRLIRLVEEAQSNRSQTEIVVDAFARSYTPTVMVFAIVMCTVPWIFGFDVGRYWTLNGLIIVVVACPCALTISTPVTYAAALAATAQRGIIVKGGGKLEAMGSIDRIVFDKTGTLTKGNFSVKHLKLVGNSKTREQMLQLMVLMQERSSHPLAVSLVEAADQEGVKSPRHILITNHTILKGEGITAVADREVVYVGNQRLFNRLGMLQQLSSIEKQNLAIWSRTGGTLGFIGIEGIGIIGMFCVVDTIREEAFAVIKGLKDLGIDTLICTGDNDSAAQTVARQIGIPPSAVHSQLLPEDKLHFVGSLKRPGSKSFALCGARRYVLFCGDGINDAPALAIADVGVSMGEGAAMAMEISDVTLMDSNLRKLLYTVQMGKRVLRTVKENICISLVAKAFVVVATFFGMTTLLVAIVSDVGIMLLVTLNGMKLLPSRNSELEESRQYKRLSGKRVDDEDVEEMTPLTYVDSNSMDDSDFDAKMPWIV